MKELNDFEIYIQQLRISQMPKKCQTCECMIQGISEKGDIFFICELEKCYLDKGEQK